MEQCVNFLIYSGIAASVSGVISYAASTASVAHYKDGVHEMNNEECGKSRFVNYHTEDYVLLKNYPRLIDDPMEVIINLWSCISPLNNVPEATPLIYHTFIVVNTNSGFWSFEKFDTGLLGQFAKQFDGVSNVFLNVKRKGKIIKKYDVKGYKISDIFKYIIDTELNIRYSVTTEYNNCHGFTIRLINKFVTMKNEECGESWFLNYHTEDNVLLKNYPRLIDDPMEVIINLWSCESPLNNIFEGMPLLYHTFIVVNTDSGFWSFEKYIIGIFGQFAKQFDGVSNVSLNVKRKGEIIKKYDVKGYNISDIFNYIIDDELNIPYSFTTEHNNNQEFTIRLIKKFTIYKSRHRKNEPEKTKKM